MTTIPQAMATAIRHQQCGRLQSAEQIYRQILAVEPNHADAFHLLGMIAYQTGRLDEAVACWRRVLELRPDFAEAHFNLSVAFKDQGRLDEAVACCRRALELKPDVADTHNNLGNLLREQGKPHEAAACYRRALELKPDFARAHYNLGNALGDRGNLDEAAASYRRALELKPEFAEAHSNLGNILRDQGKPDQAVACWRRAVELRPGLAETHYNLGVAFKDQGKTDEAIVCCRRAVQLKPEFAEAHNNLGNALRDQGDLGEAVACCRRAVELKPGFAEAHNNLGNALKDQGKVDEALVCYRRALELRPDFAQAHYNLGSASEQAGDFPGAEESFRAAVRHDPRFALAHFNLAELLRGRLPEDDLAQQRRLLDEGPVSGEHEELTDAQRLLLHFGLGLVLDARGEYAEAAGHLARANALQLSQWRARGQAYDWKEHERFVTRMIEVCTPDFFAGVRGFGLESEVPVFIVGLPRSGTTLVEQILASHSQVFGAGETQLAADALTALTGQIASRADNGYVAPEPGPSLDGLRRLDRETARGLALRHLEVLHAFSPAARRIVDKMPDNYLYLGLLACLFPRAKIIHCRRDLRDVALSCWMTHFHGVRWANDAEHIAARFREYRRMMAHWRQVSPVRLLEVDYEETVADLEGVARRLVAWCGLDWDPSCLDFHKAQRPVRTASAVQVRQPVFQTSVGRWRHYEEHMAPLFAELEGSESKQ